MQVERKAKISKSRKLGPDALTVTSRYLQESRHTHLIPRDDQSRGVTTPSKDVTTPSGHRSHGDLVGKIQTKKYDPMGAKVTHISLKGHQSEGAVSPRCVDRLRGVRFLELRIPARQERPRRDSRLAEM